MIFLQLLLAHQVSLMFLSETHTDYPFLSPNNIHRPRLTQRPLSSDIIGGDGDDRKEFFAGEEKET
jgi:hypothetical protein